MSERGKLFKLQVTLDKVDHPLHSVLRSKYWAEPTKLHDRAPQEMIPACCHQAVQLLALSVGPGQREREREREGDILPTAIGA